MNSDLVNTPAARSWRDISQPVKARAMSRGGRLRVVFATVRTVSLAALFGGFAWCAWSVYSALQHAPDKVPALAKSVPMKAPELRTSRNGVLGPEWLAGVLAIPPGTSLMELDLEKLRARVLADQQVLTASLTRLFPDRLVVQITERTPVARVRVERSGVLSDLLVARDGVMFFGHGYDPAVVATLPWLDGFAAQAEGAGYRPIAGMEVVARLLADAQFSAPELYHSWQVVSLARLGLDGEIEVLAKNGTTAVFSTKREFFLQLAKLDYIVEKYAHHPSPVARIDLTLGREVPLSFAPSPLVDLKPSPRGAAGARPSSSSHTQREL